MWFANDRYQDDQSEYRQELEDLYRKDYEDINARTEEMKKYDEEPYLLRSIRNMLADFMGIIELRMRNQDRIKRYESGEGIAGSRVKPRSLTAAARELLNK
jgi:hypothetical protein